MTKKIIEKEYDLICDIADSTFQDLPKIGPELQMDLIYLDYMTKLAELKVTMPEDELIHSYEEVIAIANPVTRKWAYENIVEKETKYLLTSQNYG